MTTKTKFYQRIPWNYSHTATTHYKTTITNKPPYLVTICNASLTIKKKTVPPGNELLPDNRKITSAIVIMTPYHQYPWNNDIITNI